MNEEQLKLIQELRIKGFAVTIFTPEELRGASPDSVEDIMIERGWDVINCLADEEVE